MSEAQTPNGTTPEPTDPLNNLESLGESVADSSAGSFPPTTQPSPAAEAQTASDPSVPPAGEERTDGTEDKQRMEFIGDDGGMRLDSNRESPATPIETSDKSLFEIDTEELLEFEPIQAASVNISEETTDAGSSSAESDTDMLELIALSEALQQQNTDLLTHVEELEKLLDESQRALEMQIARSQNAETKLAEQMKELNTTQEQLTRLFRELEASHQVAHRQQILIETLSQQLQSSQERVAHLERQCAFIQQRYNEQAQALLQTETARQELQDRLQRQQRYTLQFKAALDKCLEVPALKELNSENSFPSGSVQLQNYSQNLSEALELLLKPQPIKPWTAETESPTEEINLQERIGGTLSLPQFPSRTEYPIEKAAAESFANPFFDIVNTDLPLESATNSTANIDNEADEELWAELERLTQDTVETAKVTASENPQASDSPSLENSHDVIKLPEENSEKTPPPERESVPQIPALESSIVPAATGESSALKPNPSSPSPIVYPQRPPKKIKSLAAIDLPSFPPINKAK